MLISDKVDVVKNNIPTASRSVESAQLAKDVDLSLSLGGKIKNIKVGVSGFNPNLKSLL